jgi:hypothetical protein
MTCFFIKVSLRGRRVFLCLIAAACVLSARSGLAVEVVFQLEGPNSLLAAPFVEALQMPMTAQDPEGASLTTTYSGTVTVDVDDVMNPTTITFISANAVAANSGNWLPQEGGGDVGDPNMGGDANPGTPMPANYGFVLDVPDFVTFYGAVRDSILSYSSPAKPVTGGEFDPIDIAITIPQGWFDGNISSVPLSEFESANRQSITGQDGLNCRDDDGMGDSCASMASYIVSGNEITLTVPMNFFYGGGTPVVQFTGTLVATASLEEPTGDYNGDGTVDAADYVVWRDNIGTDAGYNLWRSQFGQTVGNGAGATANLTIVPEPAGMALSLMGILAALPWIVRRRSVV